MYLQNAFWTNLNSSKGVLNSFKRWPLSLRIKHENTHILDPLLLLNTRFSSFGQLFRINTCPIDFESHFSLFIIRSLLYKRIQARLITLGHFWTLPSNSLLELLVLEYQNVLKKKTIFFCPFKLIIKYIIPQQTSLSQIKITSQREYLSFSKIIYPVILSYNDEKSVYINKY